jgi:radical SAM superfamily enzyme YgiQ (UPF0313 family)
VIFDATIILCPIYAVSQPHLGIAYLLAALSRSGIYTRLLDLNLRFFHSLPPVDRQRWATANAWREDLSGLLAAFSRECEPLLPDLASESSGVLGLSLYANNFMFVDSLISRIRELNPRKQIVLGGPGLSVPALLSFFQRRRAFSYVVDGEAESSFPALVQCLIHEREPAVPGTRAFSEEPLPPPARCPPAPINDLAFPTFDAFDLDRFVGTPRVLPLLLSRGCAYRCRFCVDRPYFGPLRLRDPGLVLAELDYHLRTQPARVFHCHDLLVNGDLAHLESLCDQLAAFRRGRDEFFLCAQAVARPDMTPALFSKMREAGFSTISYGLESLCDRVLRQLGKPFGRAVAEQTIRESARAGLVTQLNIIVGAQDETEADFQETLEGLRRLAPFVARFGSLSPLEVHPTSSLHRSADRHGIRLAERADAAPDDLEHVRSQLYAPSRWVSAAVTPEIRDKRLRRVLQLAAELGIPVHGVNDGQLP